MGFRKNIKRKDGHVGGLCTEGGGGGGGSNLLLTMILRLRD